MKYNNIEKILSKNNCLFFHNNSTKSTMDDAKNYVEKFGQNLIVISENQTNGRGRRGNKWISDYGNIFCSIAIKNKLPRCKIWQSDKK